MPDAVFDTNVIVSALLNPSGVPGQLLESVFAGKVRLLIDERIRGEYQEVLGRRGIGFTELDVAFFMEFLDREALLVSPLPLQLDLPDPDDRIFLEAAHTLFQPILVTGNLRDFPADKRHGVRVLTPREFLDELLGSGALEGETP